MEVVRAQFPAIPRQEERKIQRAVPRFLRAKRSGASQEIDEKKFYFHAINKVFYFISEGAGIFADLEEKKLVSPDYFWYGYTTDGYQLAVYTGEEEKKFGANYKIRPGVYVISKANAHRYDMSKFQAIEFVGGILNNLYHTLFRNY